jgi:hypothetical protein
MEYVFTGEIRLVVRAREHVELTYIKLFRKIQVIPSKSVGSSTLVAPLARTDSLSDYLQSGLLELKRESSVVCELCPHLLPQIR